MDDNPYEPPKEPDTNIHGAKSLPYLERMRELESQKQRKRWKLWRIAAWLMVSGVMGGFVHFIIIDLEYTREILLVDVASICLFAAGILLSVIAPAIANQI